MTQPPDQEPGRVALSFQTRLTLTLLAAAIIPLAIFGVLLIASGAVDPEIGERLLLFMFAIAVAIGVLGGSVVGLNLVAPLREISTAVSRVSDGDLTPADPRRRERRPCPAGREPQPAGCRFANGATASWA